MADAHGDTPANETSSRSSSSYFQVVQAFLSE